MREIWKNGRKNRAKIYSSDLFSCQLFFCLFVIYCNNESRRKILWLKNMVVSAGRSFIVYLKYVCVVCAYLRSVWIQKLKMNDDEIYPVAWKAQQQNQQWTHRCFHHCLNTELTHAYTFTFTCAQFGRQFKERREKHNKTQTNKNERWKQRNKNKRLYSSFHARAHVVFFAFTFFEPFFWIVQI